MDFHLSLCFIHLYLFITHGYNKISFYLLKKGRKKPLNTDIFNPISNLRIPVASRNTKEHKTSTSGRSFSIKLAFPGT